MRPEPLPRAARPLARHADALLRAAGANAGAGTGDRAKPQGDPHGTALALAGQRIARELAPRLARFTGDTPPTVTSSPPRAADTADLAKTTGRLAANTLFELPGGPRFVVSLEAAALLRMLDRAFGGRGDVPEPLPPALPLSAQLLCERVEGAVAQALAAALGRAEATPLALRRDGDIAQVTPFAADEPLRLFGFDVTEAAGVRWRMTLAFAEAALPPLLGTETTGSHKAVAADPCAAPFGDMPLPLTARLVDMAMPLARLSRLRVGDVLPVAVARQVPLHLGRRAIARGTIGALDDRVAVQLTEAFR